MSAPLEVQVVQAFVITDVAVRVAAGNVVAQQVVVVVVVVAVGVKVAVAADSKRSHEDSAAVVKEDGDDMAAGALGGRDRAATPTVGASRIEDRNGVAYEQVISIRSLIFVVVGTGLKVGRP